MSQVAFLYNGGEPGSVELLDGIRRFELALGFRCWSDRRVLDAGFGAEFREALARSDAIIHCVGPKGLGTYQRQNEIDATVDALQGRPGTRLILVRHGGAAAPPQFERFAEFAERRRELELAAPDPLALLRIALPDLARGIGSSELPAEQELARDILGRTLEASRRPRSLTIVIGPYAVAEAEEPRAAPARAIRAVLKRNALPGYAPWLDIAGSVARALAADDEEALNTMSRAFDETSAAIQGPLGLFLRLVAANWQRRPGTSRLILVLCTPDLRLDIALRSAAMPVQHVRLVNRPEAGLYAERVRVVNGQAVREQLEDASAQLRPEDRVVLVKPFGCFESDADDLLLTAEQWRKGSAGRSMPLPTDFALEMSRSYLVVLGAGVFTPSLQVLFTDLLQEALRNPEGHSLRCLLHHPQVRVPDPLHRLERAVVAREDKVGQRFATWVDRTYGLRVERMSGMALLRCLDSFLSRD